MATLHNWKEISRYLGRGIRTAQRWEEEFGLPIRRTDGKDRGAVFALSSEIDEWFRSRPMLNGNKEAQNCDPPEGFNKLRSRTLKLLSVSQSNTILLRQIQAKIAAAIDKAQKCRTTSTKAAGILLTCCSCFLSDCLSVGERFPAMG
jgi:hypothetical protein